MKKAIILFDEKTILNFPFLFSLTKRYKILAYALPVAIILTSAFFYVTQHTIFGHDVTLSTNSKGFSGSGQGNSNPMSMLFGEGQQFLSKNDLQAIYKSYDFIDTLANAVADHPDFEKFNFNSIHAKKLRNFGQIFNARTDRPGVIEVLHGLLPNVYAFDSGASDYRYVLKIHTLDSLTTQALTKIIVDTMGAYRVKFLKGDVERQIVSLVELMERSRSDLKKKGGEGIQERKESLDARMADLKDRLRTAQQNLASERRSYDSLEIQVAQGRDLLEKEVVQESKGRLESYSSLRNRLKEVNSNILSISSTAEANRSASDAAILAQLKDEASRVRAQMAMQGKVERHLAGQDGLDMDKEKSNAGLSFDYEVAKKKRNRLEMEVTACFQTELDTMIQQKVGIEQLMLKVAPDLESIKMLEIKIVSMKLMATTIVSDVTFDKYAKLPASFIKSTPIQILAFSTFANIFLFMLLSVLLFLLDDRIHDEAELKTYFKEFQIIGQTPEFE